MRLLRRIALLLLIPMFLGLTGCGDDDDDDTNASTDDTTETTEAEAEGDVETYCEKILEIETIGEPEIDFETATDEEITEAAKEFAATELQPLAVEIQEAAPSEIREDIDLQVQAVEELAESGDFEATFDDPEVEAAGDRTHAYDLDNCGWESVDVAASEYAFGGIPDEIPAGPASFDLANEGAEFHELIVIRKNDDTTESFEELLQLPEDQALEKVTMVAGIEPIAGGEGEYSVAELEAGEYIALCFIPVGTTDLESPPEGPPHFTQGMQQEFRVS